MIKNCEYCGSGFNAARATARFCSRPCLYKGLQKEVILVCHQCGDKFTRKPYEVRQGKSKFCSPECYAKSSVGHPSRFPDPTEERTCPACGSIFVVGGRGHPMKDQVFCSNACKLKAHYRKSGYRANSLGVEDAAYIAGFIDGEGSIMLIGRQGGAHVRLTVANTDLPILEWLRDITSVGQVYQQREASDTHKQSFSWRCHAEGAEDVIRQVRPYLRIKAAQADLAIETQDRLRDPALKADRAWQAEYRERMQALNRRGPAVLEGVPA